VKFTGSTALVLQIHAMQAQIDRLRSLLAEADAWFTKANDPSDAGTDFLNGDGGLGDGWAEAEELAPRIHVALTE
jgi:hypothetical protein